MRILLFSATVTQNITKARLKISILNHTLSAAEDFRKASGNAGLRKDLLSFWGYALSPDSRSGLTERDRAKALKYIPEYMLAEKESRASSDYAVLSELMSEADRIEKNYPSVEDPDVLISYRADILRNKSVVDISRDAWGEIYNSTESMAGGSINLDASVNLSSDMKNLFSEIFFIFFRP